MRPPTREHYGPVSLTQNEKSNGILTFTVMLDTFRIFGRGLYRKLRLLILQCIANTKARIVSQTLLVMGATLSPSLSALLPPPHQMDAIIEDVVQEIERYAHLAPSLRLSAEILREAEERRRVML